MQLISYMILFYVQTWKAFTCIKADLKNIVISPIEVMMEGGPNDVKAVAKYYFENANNINGGVKLYHLAGGGGSDKP